jgi:YHS domain-containing protein
MSISRFFKAVVLGLLLASPCAAEVSNEFCPVMPTRKATDRHTAVYEGKEVRFCCSECIKEFEENPQVYVSLVPQLKTRSWYEKFLAVLNANSLSVVVSSLAGSLVVLRLARWRWTADVNAQASRAKQWVVRPVPVAIPLAIVVVLVSGLAWKFYCDLYFDKLEDQIHFATFYDFGYPPVPAQPPIENRIQSTYYRGNDERSPALGFRGNYRTATFHLSLSTATNDPLRYGDDIQDQELFVRLVIDRPPFTPDFLYSEKLMEKMFLTKECDRFLGRSGRIADQVNLTMTKPMQQWEARFPIGTPQYQPGKSTERLYGIIYLCEEQYFAGNWWSTAKNSRGGSRFHYGIQYDLDLRDGKIAADSNLYMGYLYRTRKFPTWKVPFDQWFSTDPTKIPELTQPNTTDDPEILGISDYEQ